MTSLPAHPIATAPEKQRRGGWIYQIARSQAVHHILGRTGIYSVMNAVLSRFPVRKKLSSGIVLRIRSLAGVSLYEELFSRQPYLAAIQAGKVGAFIDLGCNTGWFPCYVAHIHGDRDFAGLMIDADPMMVAEARWHIAQNALNGCEVRNGMAGASPGQSEAVFYINPANTQSSALPLKKNHPFPLKGRIVETKVPAINVGELWQQRFPHLRVVDLMKIDIEGSELSYLQAESEFLRERVRRLAVEWHAWHVSFEEMSNFLVAKKFVLKSVCEEDESCGIAYFENTQLSSPEPTEVS
jgi:FkbM family methyltransferase